MQKLVQHFGKAFLVAFMMISASSCSDTTAPHSDPVNLDVGDAQEVIVHVYGYTMGPNNEIYSPEGQWQLYSVTSQLWQVSAGTNGLKYAGQTWSANYEWNVLMSGNAQIPYIGGSVGIQVLTTAGWQWIGSFSAAVGTNPFFNLPSDATVMLVANPESGYYLLPNQGFEMTAWGGGVRIMGAGAVDGLNIGFGTLP